MCFYGFTWLLLMVTRDFNIYNAMQLTAMKMSYKKACSVLGNKWNISKLIKWSLKMVNSKDYQKLTNKGRWESKFQWWQLSITAGVKYQVFCSCHHLLWYSLGALSCWDQFSSQLVNRKVKVPKFLLILQFVFRREHSVTCRFT